MILVQLNGKKAKIGKQGIYIFFHYSVVNAIIEKIAEKFLTDSICRGANILVILGEEDEGIKLEERFDINCKSNR